MAPQAGRESWNELLEDPASTLQLPLRADARDPLEDDTLPNIPVLAREDLAQRAAREAQGDAFAAQLEALERRIGELTTQLERLTRAVAERDSTIDGLRLEQSRLEAELERSRFLGEDLDGMRREAELRAGTAESRAASAEDHARELESDLRAAEEQILRLESELRLRGSRASADRVAQEQEEAASVEVPPALQPEVTVVASTPPAAANDGYARYLVLTDGDAEIVHVLGRRTTIGRAPDNDLRIDTKFISRNHAVVLAGPAQTVLEDLRSTNGVMVNGRRVTRAALRDGDVVHIGKTQFRYVQRLRDRA